MQFHSSVHSQEYDSKEQDIQKSWLAVASTGWREQEEKSVRESVTEHEGKYVRKKKTHGKISHRE